MAGAFSNCCCGPSVRESKFVAVVLPWKDFWRGFVADGELFDYEPKFPPASRFLTQTEVRTGFGFELVTIYRYSQHIDKVLYHFSETGTDPGALGALLSRSTSREQIVETYDNGTMTFTLTEEVTLQAQMDLAQSILDEKFPNASLKAVTFLDGYTWSAGYTAAQAKFCFPSQAGSLDGADLTVSKMLLFPKGETDPAFPTTSRWDGNPWDGESFGIYKLDGFDGHAQYGDNVWAMRGWPDAKGFTGAPIDFTVNKNLVSREESQYGTPDDFFVMAGKSCQSLPEGLSCAITSPKETSFHMLDTGSGYEQEGVCGAWILGPGWYDFDGKIVYPYPGGTIIQTGDFLGDNGVMLRSVTCCPP